MSFYTKARKNINLFINKRINFVFGIFFLKRLYMKKELLKDYKKELDDVFYSTKFLSRGLNKFVDKLDELKIDIPYDTIKEYYDNQAVVQVFKPYQEVKQYHPILSYYPFQRVFIDTMYLTQKKSVLAFVNIIDLFSKYAFSKMFIIPARTSNIPSSSSVIALKEFEGMIPKGMEIDIVNSDRGSEYKGNFNDYLDEKDYVHVFSNVGDHLAQSPIERFNRTLRLMIEKYRSINNVRIDNNILKEIIYTYNNTTHSNFSYTPQEILDNEKYQLQLFGYYTKLNKTYNDVKVSPLTGYVRVLLDLSSFQKIKPVWSVDIYKIKSYHNNFYTLEGLDKIYRREQLQPVDKDLVMKNKIKILDDKEYNDVEVIDNKVIVQNDIKEKRVRKPNSKYL